MKKNLLAVVVFLVVVASVMALDPTLRPPFLNEWINSQSGRAISTATADSGEDDSAEPIPIGMIDTGIVPTVGQPAADFALRDLNRDIVQLSSFRGEKHVVVNFWATWCSPCVVEMPDLEEVYQEFGDELVVLGVNIQESRDVVRRFVEDEVQVTYPILFDHEGQVTSGYNVFAQPSTFFVNKAGDISPINRFPGKFGAFTPDELKERIDQFLADEPETDQQN